MIALSRVLAPRRLIAPSSGPERDKMPSPNSGALATRPAGAKRSLQLWWLAALVCVAQCAAAANQKDLLCRATDDPDDWIESIRISPSQGKVWLKLKSQGPAEELSLLHFTADGSDQPTYAFNDAVAGTKVINAFRVFRVAEQWRLISAGMEEHQGTLTLLALGSKVKLDCSQVASAVPINR